VRPRALFCEFVPCVRAVLDATHNKPAATEATNANDVAQEETGRRRSRRLKIDLPTIYFQVEMTEKGEKDLLAKLPTFSKG
jgi:hypothetical protein